ncbi:hypothetical protein ACQKJG_18810 [Priestia megaterium]|uniref:hypothetical protein n=1 Tax=Priestia megaterium TaxID=1404 RepID=UPI003D03D070
MNQLLDMSTQFTFLPKAIASYDLRRLKEEVTDIYLKAMDDFSYSDEWKGEVFVPSQAMILSTGWDLFEDYFMDYILAGHDPNLLAELKYDFESGLTEDDVVEGWREMKYHNASYGVFYTNKTLEKELLNDLNNGLQLFNISFFLCNRGENVFSHEEIKLEKWINPPLIGVW